MDELTDKGRYMCRCAVAIKKVGRKRKNNENDKIDDKKSQQVYILICKWLL